ncbi:molecular chaperone DnaJ [Mycolicibacterium mucogenicum]|uniref:molecular chaperone DnaJ n=1 Tax=Mycolicibacterium mucogenicum TaxID=56689 RepID=UPI00226A8CAC|nr:molecular chaperone DnaJ [Mycolicibacterium mucogenicum]MCX8559807.1 molecular chaperone DnaJ [Mycolicibacterium mucogenicum]
MTLRPLVGWPHPETRDRGRSPFSATWTATLELLDRELWHLKNGHGNAPSVLQIALREQDFRIDGMPRANAIPSHPGVILNIESSKGPLSYPCDKFNRWQDNLRAIALGLEALRKISRYGITPGDEQYAGWRALPQQASGLSFTAASALEFLRSAAGSDDDPTLRIGSAVQLYRRARAAAHPDRNGGDRSKWDQVEAAAAVLRTSGQLP